jgi:6-phosphofructokinase 1
MKTIALMTSGNDAPGMNSAIRAVTRSAIYNGLRVKAVRRGYKGLIDGEIVEFQTQNVSNIIQQGGTILKSSPSKDFFSEEGRRKAYENLQREEVDALVVIGGDGTIHGARIFAQEYDLPCIAIPATIDNNLCGTDTTIGYDTALNTIMQCVDKIRDTASSHERLFFVEVLGDDAGFLALNGAIASGCEEAIIPNKDSSTDELLHSVLAGFRKTKSSSIVLVAASEEHGGARKYADLVKKTHPNLDVRISILGHLQRGGHPTAHDRIIASRMGSAAIEALKKGLRNVMIGIDNDEIVYVPFSRAVKENRRIDHDLFDILHDVAI